MKCTTSEASVRSNDSSANGSRSADAYRTSTAGNLARLAATKDDDGSTADTNSAPSRSPSTDVSAPGPQPTSSARCPGRGRTNDANSTASGSEYLPMKRP
ncbi:hypothetical protein B0I29_122168 [Actinoplanes lutulentus]|uniref:Uncharacterized protein n=1 Tax=Actinoplanes lutulentus TaxID=1287878 RepID=A0A327Z3T2_9ACTN|nr:hypothetical protein B0I29_122168 [Actinoplanes lutulentus]